MNQKNQKGITLIALVITIIVLLILAGVTINMVLGDDGIIKQAQAAKEAQEKGEDDDLTAIAKTEAAMLDYTEQTAMTEEQLEALKKEDGTTPLFNFDENAYNGNVAKVTEDGVPIPLGFAHVQGTTKDDGLVIVDSSGNEFVWIPVDGTNVQVELDPNYGNKNNIVINSQYIDKTIIADGIIENEYLEMKKSVEIYGGFYVGRYETSWTGTKVATVPNVESMHMGTPVEELDSSYDIIDDDGMGATWYTFYAKQKELYGKESSVVSGMIYASQWDAIMDWLSDVKNPYGIKSEYYIFDATKMGHYFGEICPDCNNGYDAEGNQCESCGGDLIIYPRDSFIKTGSNPEYMVKNIYDLAGNYGELVVAFYSPDNACCCGDGMDAGTWGPAKGYTGYPLPVANPGGSSRLQLYIK